ncbi:MAG TPA: hypothetical protein ACFCUY_04085 [Xenococcaceae cyanobacterium]|jgi:hypothetical protein
MYQNIIYGYIIISLICFLLWLWLFTQDKTTPNNHLLSWIILLFAPWFWPIVLPISLWELINKLISEKKAASKFD